MPAHSKMRAENPAAKAKESPMKKRRLSLSISDFEKDEFAQTSKTALADPMTDYMARTFV